MLMNEWQKLKLTSSGLDLAKKVYIGASLIYLFTRIHTRLIELYDEVYILSSP